jgi:glycosyltransferase involved in cell wall biosynthesis
VIDEHDKAAVLSAARAFAFPSLYEGFGLPPLEAMALPSRLGAAAALSPPDRL